MKNSNNRVTIIQDEAELEITKSIQTNTDKAMVSNNDVILLDCETENLNNQLISLTSNVGPPATWADFIRNPDISLQYLSTEANQILFDQIDPPVTTHSRSQTRNVPFKPSFARRLLRNAKFDSENDKAIMSIYPLAKSRITMPQLLYTDEEQNTQHMNDTATLEPQSETISWCEVLDNCNAHMLASSQDWDSFFNEIHNLDIVSQTQPAKWQSLIQESGGTLASDAMLKHFYLFIECESKYSMEHLRALAELCLLHGSWMGCDISELRRRIAELDLSGRFPENVSLRSRAIAMESFVAEKVVEHRQ